MISRVVISWWFWRLVFFQLQDEQQKEPDRKRPVLGFAAASLPSLILYRWVWIRSLPVGVALFPHSITHTEVKVNKKHKGAPHFSFALTFVGSLYVAVGGKRISATDYVLLGSCGEEMQEEGPYISWHWQAKAGLQLAFVWSVFKNGPRKSSW